MRKVLAALSRRIKYRPWPAASLLQRRLDPILHYRQSWIACAWLACGGNGGFDGPKMARVA